MTDFMPGWFWAVKDDHGTVIPVKNRLVEWFEHDPVKDPILEHYQFERVIHLPVAI